MYHGLCVCILSLCICNRNVPYCFPVCLCGVVLLADIDMERVVQESVEVFCSTPRSVIYRQHERPRPDPSQASPAHNASQASQQDLVSICVSVFVCVCVCVCGNEGPMNVLEQLQYTYFDIVCMIT